MQTYHERCEQLEKTNVEVHDHYSRIQTQIQLLEILCQESVEMRKTLEQKYGVAQALGLNNKKEDEGTIDEEYGTIVTH